MLVLFCIFLVIGLSWGGFFEMGATVVVFRVFRVRHVCWFGIVRFFFGVGELIWSVW